MTPRMPPQRQPCTAAPPLENERQTVAQYQGDDVRSNSARGNTRHARLRGEVKPRHRRHLPARPTVAVASDTGLLQSDRGNQTRERNGQRWLQTVPGGMCPPQSTIACLRSEIESVTLPRSNLAMAPRIFNRELSRVLCQRCRYSTDPRRLRCRHSYTGLRLRRPRIVQRRLSRSTCPPRCGSLRPSR